MLPVDAHPAALRWSDDTVARNRIQTYDASFGLEATDPLSLHRESAAGMTTLGVARKPAVKVFDDTDPNAYYDPANPLGSDRGDGHHGPGRPDQPQRHDDHRGRVTS